MASFSLADSRSTPAFLFSNIGNLISIKLDSQNYLLWKSRFLPVLRAHGMVGFVDGTCLCPPEFLLDSTGIPTQDVNPQYLAWIQQDQNVLCWINATLSAAVLAHVVGLKTARDVWLALEKRFASLSRSHIIQLKTQLRSIKKGSQPITEYIQRIKHLADSLAAVLCPVDDEDLIIHTLNGLPSDYGPFKTSIRTRSSPISLEELHVLLLCKELSLESSHAAIVDYATSAFLASKDNSSARFGSGPPNRGSGKSSNRGKALHKKVTDVSTLPLVVFMSLTM
ncbi:hypothetical protein MRB53_032771 [Persea americana]|uniref:Uncharacterized protein n=1 Tax=Persea americana TaxID=3435 RepID=A0ACC2KSV3_PERAE|nr:hypothetical protein MRB53_032771 [Persea americana]